MRKMTRRALSMLLVLVMLATAMPALAMEFSGIPDLPKSGLAGIVIDDVTIKSGPMTIDLGLRLELSAGMDATEERALMNLALLAGDKGAKALEFFGAIEDGLAKVYAQNEGGGLPYAIQVPLEDLMSVIEDTQSAVSSDEDMELMTELITNYIAAIMSMQENPEASAAVLAAMMGSIDIQLGEAEKVVIFGKTIDAQVVTMEFTMLELMQTVDAIYQSTPEMQALFASFEKLLAQEGTSWDEVMEEMSESGEDITFLATIYAGDEYVRVAVVATQTELEEHASFILDAHIGENGGEFAMEVIDPYEESVLLMTLAISEQSTSVNGVDTTNMTLDFAVDSEDEAFELSFEINTASEEATGARSFALSLLADTDDGRFGVTLGYDGVVSENETKGIVSMGMQESGESIGEITFTLETFTGPMPEGALMTVDGLETLNPLTASEDELEELNQAFETLLTNVVVTLMQSPALAEMMGGVMGGASDALGA